MGKLKIGIDPGTKTGIAAVDDGKLVMCKTMSIIQAMELVLSCHRGDILYIEDARKRKWFDDSGYERLQGAGSIKRDCAIWQNFCDYYKIEYVLVSPQQKGIKIGAKMLERLTGYTGRTSVHARDAAALVIGR